MVDRRNEIRITSREEKEVHTVRRRREKNRLGRRPVPSTGS